MQKFNFLSYSVMFINCVHCVSFQLFCFILKYWKHHLRDVLKKVLQKYINHIKLRKTLPESIKAILVEVHFTRSCIIFHIFTKMISFAMCICSFSTFFLHLQVAASDYYISLPIILASTTTSTSIFSPWRRNSTLLITLIQRY